MVNVPVITTGLPLTSTVVVTGPVARSLALASGVADTTAPQMIEATASAVATAGLAVSRLATLGAVGRNPQAV